MLDAPGGGQWNLDQSSPRTELRSSPDSGNGGSGLAIVEDVMRQRAAGEASYDVVHIERADGPTQRRPVAILVSPECTGARVDPEGGIGTCLPMPSSELRAGWHNRPCNCDPRRKFLNCLV